MLYNRGVSDLENWLAEIEVGIWEFSFLVFAGLLVRVKFTLVS